MKRLSDFLEYRKNKQFIKKFEKDSKNYDGPALLASSQYCNACVDVILYKN